MSETADWREVAVEVMRPPPRGVMLALAVEAISNLRISDPGEYIFLRGKVLRRR